MKSQKELKEIYMNIIKKEVWHGMSIPKDTYHPMRY